MVKRSRLRKEKPRKLSVFINGKKLTDVHSEKEYEKILSAIDRNKLKVRLG